MNIFIVISALNNEPFLIFFVAFLAAVVLVLFLVILIILKEIQRRAKMIAKQYSRYQDYIKKNHIVFLGDSLTEFYPVDEFFHSFSPYNRGIANDNTIGVLKRLEDNVIDLQPSKVFLQIGTNDLMQRRKNADIIKNIQEILEQLQVSLPKCELYFISLYPVNKMARLFSKVVVGRRKNKDIIAINLALYEYCKEKSITYIDIFKHLIDEKGNLRREYTFEGLHINYEGYQIISELLLPYLES